MNTALDSVIQTLLNELEAHQIKIKQLKESINYVCVANNKKPMFIDVENIPIVVGTMDIKPDTFFGKQLATAVGDYLRMKNEPATGEEIASALEKGGFVFPQNLQGKYGLKNLGISLSKNTDKFVYFRKSRSYGLLEFYPDYSAERDRKKKGIVKGDEKNSNDIEDLEVLEDLDSLEKEPIKENPKLDLNK